MAAQAAAAQLVKIVTRKKRRSLPLAGAFAAGLGAAGAAGFAVTAAGPGVGVVVIGLGGLSEGGGLGLSGGRGEGSGMSNPCSPVGGPAAAERPDRWMTL